MDSMLIYFIIRESSNIPVVVDEKPNTQAFFDKSTIEKIRADYNYKGNIYGLYQGTVFNLTYNP